MNITKNHGYVFLELIHLQEERMDCYSPIAGSYAILKCAEKYLMCYNTWREQWELPAGQREENETPKECAIRELYEETGQIVKNLEFIGLIKVKKISNGNVKYNPIYFASVNELNPFIKNHETSKIMLWDLLEPIGVIDEVDLKIFDFIQ